MKKAQQINQIRLEGDLWARIYGDCVIKIDDI